MSTELEVYASGELATPQRVYRSEVPQTHRVSLDTRLIWLWNQRFGTVQTIYQRSPDTLDQTAAMLILQSIMGKDLQSIAQLLHRIEGGPISDDEIVNRAEQESMRL